MSTRLGNIMVLLLSALVVGMIGCTGGSEKADTNKKETAMAEMPSEGNQLEQITPAFDHLNTGIDAKHTPKIEAPSKVKAGEWFDVTVTVGAEALHPTLEDHYVNWIGIYKDDVELARAYLHPVHTKPKVTFTIALERSAKLRALEQPNHTAPWEASVDITVVK